MRLLLAIDPATQSGIALIDMDTEDLIASYYIKARGGTWGAKLKSFQDQFREVILDYRPYVVDIAYERNSRFSNDLITLFVAVVALEFPGVKMSEKKNGVICSSWKKWIRQKTRLGIKDPKGIDVLALVRPDWTAEMDTDDEADACMIGYCYLAKIK